MRNFYEQLFLQNTFSGCFWKIWVYSIHARFTQGLLPLLFTFFDWKRTKWAYHVLQFFVSYWKVFEIYQVYYTIFLITLNLFLFISTFSVFLNDYFCRWLAYKSLGRFSVLINLFCDLAIYFLYPAVSHIFHGPGFLGSKVWVQVLEVPQL